MEKIKDHKLDLAKYGSPEEAALSVAVCGVAGSCFYSKAPANRNFSDPVHKGQHNSQHTARDGPVLEKPSVALIEWGLLSFFFKHKIEKDGVKHGTGEHVSRDSEIPGRFKFRPFRTRQVYPRLFTASVHTRKAPEFVAAPDCKVWTTKLYTLHELQTLSQASFPCPPSLEPKPYKPQP